MQVAEESLQTATQNAQAIEKEIISMETAEKASRWAAHFPEMVSFTSTGHGHCFWGELPNSGQGCGVCSSLCINSVGEPCASTHVASHLQARGGRVQEGSCGSRAGGRGAAGGAARGARRAGAAQGRRQRAQQPERGRAGAAGRARLRRDPGHPWPPWWADCFSPAFLQLRS